MALEAALGRIALAWAGSSDYATDVLFGPRVGQALDALVVVPGLQPDLLTAHWPSITPTRSAGCPAGQPPGGAPALHVCADGEDEAERAAACVLAHLAQGRAPVALVAGDRVLTRRISALLASRGVPLRDETGWMLSTTHAAAQVAALLHGGARRATDAVLDWLKLAPDVDAAALRALERQLRQDGVRDWLEAAARTAGQPLTARVEALRAALQAPRPLPDWLAALREALTACGAWQPLLDDAAGAAVAEALSLAPGADTDWLAWPAARRRLGLREFTRWVGETLEAASFRPRMRPVRRWSCCPSASCSAALGRPGAARRRRAAPARRARAARPWTAAQRQALHLPLRGVAAAQAAAWRVALAVPRLDVLWRTSDDSGEPLLPSPWVQALQLQGRAVRRRPAHPPRAGRQAVPVPAPSGRGARSRCRPAATRCCAPARTASLPCASSAWPRRASWKPRSTSATSASGCTRCCTAFTRPCRPIRPPRARPCWTPRPSRPPTRWACRAGRSCPSPWPGRRCATAIWTGWPGTRPPPAPCSSRGAARAPPGGWRCTAPSTASTACRTARRW
jgi:ATP-dependent helicase/nuclease subunit B